MKSRHAIITILAAIGSFALFSGCPQGCKPNGVASASSSTGIGWLTGVGENLVPGIDSGNLDLQKVGNTAIVVVWADKSFTNSSSTTTGGLGTKHTGKYFFKGDTKGTPELEWQSNDKGSGSFSCGKEKYDLKDGILFLVSTSGPEPLVKQLKRDVSNLKATREGVKAFADGDDELREFFTKLAPPNSKSEPISDGKGGTESPPTSSDAGGKE